jgi:type III restriction enzyme
VEYADVLGVPFSFAQQGQATAPKPPPRVIRVKAMEDRAEREIRFPNVEGYRVIFCRGCIIAMRGYDFRKGHHPSRIDGQVHVHPCGSSSPLSPNRHPAPMSTDYPPKGILNLL